VGKRGGVRRGKSVWGRREGGVLGKGGGSVKEGTRGEEAIVEREKREKKEMGVWWGEKKRG